MSQHSKLSATSRTVFGKKLTSLRAAGMLPANVFGNHLESTAITVNQREFEKIYEEVGETGIVDVVVDESPAVPTLISELSYHPVEDTIIHVDLRRVNLAEKITANVPLEFVGEAPAEKIGAVIVETVSELEIEALPEELPDEIQVPLEKLVAIGDSITVAMLSVPSGVEVLADPETVVVVASEPAPEEVETEPTEQPTEAETTVQGKGAEDSDAEASADK